MSTPFDVVILCGGRSTRLGQDKAGVEVGGRSMLQRSLDAATAVCERVIIAGADGQTLPPLSASRRIVVVADGIPAAGPLAGIVAGLREATSEVVAVIAVDQPFVRPTLLRALAEQAAQEQRWVIPRWQGEPQPLTSALPRTMRAPLAALLHAGTRSVRHAAEAVGVLYVDGTMSRDIDPDGESFIDVDTPAALRAAREVIATESTHGIRGGAR